MTINFGENIRKLRLAHKLTQEKLADFLGVSFQAVSKWERGDTVPDIFMLPAIASFFGVSVDYLLNFNQFEKEKEIEAYEKRYYQLWRKNERDELLCMMKEAVNRYPAEYRLLVRYLNVMVWCALDSRRALEMKNEAVSVYERIVSHCTVDSIRIWAKKIMSNYFKELSRIEGSGITLSDAERILSEMPLMQNSRDYLACFLYSDDKRDAASRSAIAELSFLMNTVILGNWVYNPIYTLDEKIGALESLLKMNDILYENGGYGKNSVNSVYVMTYLGCFYYEKGEFEKAKSLVHKSIDLARCLDKTEGALIHTCGLLAGVSAEKEKIPKMTAEPLAKTIENYIFRCKKIVLDI